jgi:ribonuclease BN (tRNA processing enzyme)
MGSSIFHIFGANMFGEDLEVAIYKAMTAPHFPVELSDLKSKKIFHTVTDSQVILLEDGNFKPTILNVYEDGDVQAKEDQTCIRMLRGYAHPKGGIMYFKIERNGKQIVYASDTEGYKNGDVKLENFSRGADILIHDAQYTESEYDASPYSFEGFGHSTPEMAITIAKKAEVKQLILFHHHPPHDDDQILEMEKKAQKSFPNTISAYEGLEISI